jgi:2-polyprenyl-3-methyl-5-hydroxy-6-metoxy-1,4-benzoquinol methylase
MDSTSPACNVCGAVSSQTLADYSSLTRVTSDCKPWPAGGRLRACSSCGTVQKAHDAVWEDEIARIYQAYTIYHQGAGAEQAVFGDAGQAMFRSDRLVARIAAEVTLPPTGRLLDIGCGNGAFLRAFAKAHPGWSLVGTEWADTNRDTVEAIPGVERLYVGADALDRVPGQFDIISLIHALEHIRQPVEMLQAVRTRLADAGLLFIEIPNAASNPFDLLVADHASHFSPSTLAAAVERAGFAVTTLSTEWVIKELSVLARPTPTPAAPASNRADDVLEGLGWLLSARAAGLATRDRTPAGRFGLFGSSIAATWLAQELGGAVSFFVDEDPSRRGARFMGRPVLTPGETPAGSVVFIGLGGGLSERVRGRLAGFAPTVEWVAAPAPRLIAT